MRHPSSALCAVHRLVAVSTTKRTKTTRDGPPRTAHNALLARMPPLGKEEFLVRAEQKPDQACGQAVAHRSTIPNGSTGTRAKDSPLRAALERVPAPAGLVPAERRIDHSGSPSPTEISHFPASRRPALPAGRRLRRMRRGVARQCYSYRIIRSLGQAQRGTCFSVQNRSIRVHDLPLPPGPRAPRRRTRPFRSSSGSCKVHVIQRA